MECIEQNDKFPVTWVLGMSKDSKYFTIDSKNIDQVMLDKTNVLGMSISPGSGDCPKSVMQEDLLEYHVKSLIDETKIDFIVNLQPEGQMKSLNFDLEKYQTIFRKYKEDMQIIHFPVKDLNVPKVSAAEFNEHLIEKIINFLDVGKKGVIHCRAGIGRAGLVTSCLLLKLKQFQNSDHAIRYLRSWRDRSCIETEDQRLYVESFESFIKQQQNIK